MSDTQSPAETPPGSSAPQRRPAVALAVVAIAVALGLGVGWAGGQGGAQLLGWPATMVCVAAAFALQWLAFVPADLAQTERFYDLTGSVGYLTVLGLALFANGVTPHGALLAALVGVWTVRLGLFLVKRVHADRGDGRFDAIKPSAPRFLVAWTLQGLWISLTAAAALAAITAPRAELGVIAILGLGVWIAGFALEVVADAQKRRHRASHPGRFIDSGLWAWSRHPNYFGEIVLWIGVAIIAAEVLSGWQWLTLISPLFVFVLLTRVSGIPLLEKRADERWGDDPAYVAYRDRTSILIPRPPA